MGWWIALAILILLAILPLGASVRYNDQGLIIKLIAGPVKLTLFPMKKKPPKKKKPEPEQKKPAPKKTAPPKQEEEKKTGGSWKDFLPLVDTALELLGDFRRKLRVNRLELKLIMAGDDPCDLAVNYGRAWAAVGNLMPRLERLFVIKKRDVEVECDFEADQTRVYARLDLTITFGRILLLGVVYGFRALKQYFMIMNKRKGGANS